IDARCAGRVAPFVLIRQRIDDRLGIEGGEFARGWLDLRTGAGSVAEDQNGSVLVLGAVPMHLFAEMGHERTGWQRNAIIGIEIRAAAHPPRAAEHGDEAVVGMEVRTAEMVSFEPFVAHEVEPDLRWVT